MFMRATRSLPSHTYKRRIDGNALLSTISLVNSILDLNMDAINEEIAKGDKGERMSVIKNIKIK